MKSDINCTICLFFAFVSGFVTGGEFVRQKFQKVLEEINKDK